MAFYSLFTALSLPLRRLYFHFVYLFVCLLAGLSKNYSTDFHKIRWKDGSTWAIRFWREPGSYHVRVRVRAVTARNVVQASASARGSLEAVF